MVVFGSGTRLREPVSLKTVTTLTSADAKASRRDPLIISLAIKPGSFGRQAMRLSGDWRGRDGERWTLPGDFLPTMRPRYSWTVGVPFGRALAGNCCI